MGLKMHFEELFKRISPILKRITYKLKGYFSFFNDEDLFQEASLHLWQDFKAGRLKDKTDSYVLQGCYFHLKNYIRTAKIRNNLVSLEAILNEDNETSQEGLFFERQNGWNSYDELNNRMLVEAISNNGLTPREKDIFLLWAQGLTTREIGKRAGISHVRVVKLMASIKKKCAKYKDNY